MSNPIVMSTPDPSDHAARAAVFLDNIHDRMRGGDGPELRTQEQKDLMATEALAHAVLALNETLRSIFPTPAESDGTPDPGRFADTTPLPPGPIPGVEHYVAAKTTDPHVYVSTGHEHHFCDECLLAEDDERANHVPTTDAGQSLSGISDVADFTTKQAKPGRWVLGTFDLNEADQDVPPTGIPASAWPHIFGAAATARATGSRGAMTGDPATGTEYAITFRLTESNDGYRITSTTPMADVSRRSDEHLISFNVLGVDPERPLGGRLSLSAWQEVIAAGKLCYGKGADRTVATDPETGDRFELCFRTDFGPTAVVDIFDGFRQ